MSRITRSAKLFATNAAQSDLNINNKNSTRKRKSTSILHSNDTINNTTISDIIETPKKNRLTKKHKKAINELTVDETEKEVKSPAKDKMARTTFAPKLCDDGKIRCWGYTNPASLEYHDTCWGRTSHSHPLNTLDQSSVEYKTTLVRAFANLTYQIMQSGISWQIVFKKIPTFLTAFDQFDIDKVANYSEKKIQELLNNAGIIRNGLKIRAVVNNAKCVLKAEKEYPGGFFGLIYHDVDHENYSEKERILPKGRMEGSYMRSDFKTKSNTRIETDGVHPSISVHRLAKRMKLYGFKFVGETVILSWMQATGIMNHHAKACHAFNHCEKEYNKAIQLRKTWNNNNIGAEAHSSNSTMEIDSEYTAKAKSKKAPQKIL